MTCSLRVFWKTITHTLPLLTAAAAIAVASPAWAVVPGSGQKVIQVGDDFEDVDWKYSFNLPKSSNNIDKQTRYPLGKSANGRWVESSLRGQPDVIERVPTPPFGLAGSDGALLMRSIQTGIPGRYTNELQQDDLLLNIAGGMGGTTSPGFSPNCVVRVFLPPFEAWEDRTGTSFAMRLGLRAYVTKQEKSGGFFGGSRSSRTLEPYWPGMFIRFNSSTDGNIEEDSAQLIIRARENGSDVWGPKITQTGWWTIGMSVTPDGRVHYYASPGVEDLTQEDHIASFFPYGYRCEAFNNFFFNVANGDNGRVWSTPWVIDDPSFYILRGGRPVAGTSRSVR
ncbi:MAG: hypothetical protein KDA42_04025 [Planctomycetales bacterium]|nr:hypothetical protein [Planctomycetales bacterium]